MNKMQGTANDFRDLKHSFMESDMVLYFNDAKINNNHSMKDNILWKKYSPTKYL